jgi:hypothetical protein
MKVVNPDDLQTALDTDLIWRRKEISSLVTLVKTCDLATKDCVLRAAVPLLYAHWEGFGKECILRYLEFVSYRRLQFKQLTPAFLYLASYPSLSRIGGVNVKDALEAIQNFIARADATNKDNFRKRVDTRSNLRWDVLEDLLYSCGLDPADIKSNGEFIDKELCDPRNKIAHGGGAAPTLDVFLRRRERAFDIMTQLQTMVVNAATNGSYKAS